MAKMIKNLNKNLMKKDSRFQTREDLDFRDDGLQYRGYEYKGLPITTCRHGGETFCDIRVDYLHNNFTWKEWSETEEYHLADAFCGVEEIDLDMLIDYCEKILVKVEELNEKAAKEELDLSGVINRLKYEKKMLDEVIEEAKTSVKWWVLDVWDLKYVKNAFDGAVRSVDEIARLISDIEKLDIKQKRYHYQRFEEGGYVKVKENDYYITRLKEAM